MNEQKPRWGKGAVTLIVAAVVFLLAAGMFGTLWILERNDHSATAGQLSDTRTQAETATAKLKEADDKRKSIADKLQETVTKQRSLEVTTESYSPCAEASRAFANAVRASDEKVLDKVSSELALWCF